MVLEPQADEPKLYKCVYYWKNDRDTFSALSVLTGDISDVCYLNPDTEVRFRAVSAAERRKIDDMLPPVSAGVMGPDRLAEIRGTYRLAHAIVSINGQPLGGDLHDRIRVLEGFPEQLLNVLSDAAWEFQVRLTLRIKGSQEQLKN